MARLTAPERGRKHRFDGRFRAGHVLWQWEAMMTIILLLLGLVCFYLFYASIDYFEKM